LVLGATVIVTYCFMLEWYWRGQVGSLMSSTAHWAGVIMHWALFAGAAVTFYALFFLIHSRLILMLARRRIDHLIGHTRNLLSTKESGEDSVATAKTAPEETYAAAPITKVDLNIKLRISTH